MPHPAFVHYPGFGGPEPPLIRFFLPVGGAGAAPVWQPPPRNAGTWEKQG